MLSTEISLYFHVIGFATGIVLYAMLGVMAWQGRSNVRWPGQPAAESRQPDRAKLLIAVAALGLLLSVSANLLHFNSYLLEAPVASPLWSWTTVVGFGLLLGLIVLYMWKSAPSQRGIAVVSIIVFAISAVHLITVDAGTSQTPLWVELVVHYAPIPLVGALLYQQYRFALADVFLKRAIGFIGLVILVTTAYLLSKWVDSRLTTLSLWLLTALIYPGLQLSVNRFVDHGILRRLKPRQVRARLNERIWDQSDEDAVLKTAETLLKDALTAKWVTIRTSDPAEVSHNHRIVPIASLRIPVAEKPDIWLAVGELAGGRRLLSGDMDLLDMAVLDIARRIDTIRIAVERVERAGREADALRLATEAELQALQAQLNPHFLFNALTTIGYLIQVAPERAQTTLLRLTDLLRAVLRKTAGDFVPLSDEIALVESYLAIEKERFEERLTVNISAPSSLLDWPVLPLSIQPLVENAIKHGIAPSAAGGKVTITVRAGRNSFGEEALLIEVKDTGVGIDRSILPRSVREGVGLSNIDRRLAQIYGPRAAMNIDGSLGQGTVVELIIPMPSSVGPENGE